MKILQNYIPDIFLSFTLSDILNFKKWFIEHPDSLSCTKILCMLDVQKINGG